MPISDTLIADFKSEASNTKRVLESFPEGRSDWKPHAKSMSLGRLAGHIAELPSLVHSVMEGEELDFAASAGEYTPFVAASRTELLQIFQKNVDRFETALSGQTDEFLSKNWTLRYGPNVLMSMPRHLAIRTTAIHHVIHHRGQFSVYLRLLDVAVPPTYGPTADSQGL